MWLGYIYKIIFLFMVIMLRGIVRLKNLNVLENCGRSIIFGELRIYCDVNKF